jgi:uncharacterized surface protein with fasciclin (FAS1) repeats
MPDLMETAVNAGNLNTLIKAVQTAKIVDTLKSPDIFTLFAPTDEAFAQLSQKTLDALLQDTAKLQKIVCYHIAFGDVRSDDLVQIEEAQTLEGSVLAIESTSDGIKVNNANVLETDILADNGVIHVIDAVLMPALISRY